MPKQKAQAETEEESESPPTVDVKPEPPEVEGFPTQVSRAADVLTGETPTGAGRERARLASDMQQRVGNARLGRMLEEDERKAEQGDEALMRQAETPAAGPESAPVEEQEQEAAQGETPALQRKPASGASKPKPAKVAKRQDVVVIVGRPSMTTADRENAAEKEQMATWRAAARALSPTVFEGLTVDRAFAGLKKLKTPIDKLYIIAHADPSGIGEVGRQGQSVSTTVKNLTKRIKKAAGALGARKPRSVEMLSCFGGESPKTMARIGKALGAGTVRAPVQTTVISGRTFIVNGKRLTRKRAGKLKPARIQEYIDQTDAVKLYDFVPGVPHPKSKLSKKAKMNALVDVVQRTGMVPFVAFNAEAGKREAVPYWKADVTKKAPGAELTDAEQLTSRGVIEVSVEEPEKEP